MKLKIEPNNKFKFKPDLTYDKLSKSLLLRKKFKIYHKRIRLNITN